jgi:hypothetical protein
LGEKVSVVVEESFELTVVGVVLAASEPIADRGALAHPEVSCCWVFRDVGGTRERGSTRLE